MVTDEKRKQYERPVLTEIGAMADITENGTNRFNGPWGPRSGGHANSNANINANPGGPQGLDS